MGDKSFISSSAILIKSRKEALGLWVWCSVTASLMVGRGFPPLGPTLLAIAATTLVTVGVYVYNDVVDMDADKNNSFKDDRPLTSGEVSRDNAMNLVYISSIAGLGISLFLNFTSFLFNLLYFVTFSLYSLPGIHLKKRFLMKETVISLGLVIVGMSVNYALIGTFSQMVFVGLMMFAVFAFCAMPTGFDSTDVDADKIQGVQSIATNITYQQRLQLAMGGMLLIMGVTPFTYKALGYNVLLPMSITLMGVAFLGLLIPVMRSIDPVNGVDSDTINSTRKVIISFIFVICFCVILGSLNLTAISSVLF